MYCAVPVCLVGWMLLSNCSGSMHALVYGTAHTRFTPPLIMFPDVCICDFLHVLLQGSKHITDLTLSPLILLMHNNDLASTFSSVTAS